jgi:hypothetical protein
MKFYGFFCNKKKLDKTNENQIELEHFYQQLMKMKKNRPDLNIERIMKKLNQIK